MTSFCKTAFSRTELFGNLEIIGEAAKNVSSTFRDAHPELPWSQMTGTRNKLVHDYFEANLFIVWDTVQSDLPPLKQQVEHLLRMLGEDHGESEKL